MRSRERLVLQHIACEPPRVYEDMLREPAATIHRVELDEGEPLPPWQEFDAIVCMGGPMSATDDAELPWLAEENSSSPARFGQVCRSGACASASSFSLRASAHAHLPAR